jgi:hypothetical protein
MTDKVLNPYKRAVEGVQKVASKQDEANIDPAGNPNPQSFPGNDPSAIRAAISGTGPVSESNRMFDKEGQINAWDQKDAMTQIAHLLQNVTKNTGSTFSSRNASTVAPEERRKVLASALQDPTGEGFAILGQELLLPIKDIVDYEGWARKVLRVRPLAQGELFRIAKDVRATAWVVGQDGQSIESRLYGKYVQPSEFKITAYPTVDIEDIYQMNYDVLDRAQDTARQEIELEEDKRCLAILDAASTTVNATSAFGTDGVDISEMEAVRYQVERHRLVCEKFLINRQELSDLISLGNALDPVTQRELLLAGYVGTLFNAQVITAAGTGVEEVVPAGTIYACAGSEYLGEMGVRVELFSEPFNKFSHRESVKGWAFIEMVGFGITNPRAVARMKKVGTP